MRQCVSCGRDLPQSSFTANEYSKGLGISQCVACVDGHNACSPPVNQSDSGRYNSSTGAKVSNEDHNNPFAEGTLRWVAKGTYVSGPREGGDCVFKWFKTGGVFEEDYFTLDIRAVDKALEIVNKFNDLNITNRLIKVNVPEVWVFDEDAKWPGQHVLCERFIQNYHKFNSNTGWSDDSEAWGEAMQALSHFSYHISSSQFVLCGLQGGVYQHEVILSDPVILSRNRDYGVTDLGPDGISSFFSQHRCNNYCRPNWTQPANPIQRFSPVASTTMTQHLVPMRDSRPAGTYDF
ncbi:kinase-like protein [Hypoxylon sp. NC1633]|nr:kinase-like protein [Hypoxylon sp. NC1633]